MPYTLKDVYLYRDMPDKYVLGVPIEHDFETFAIRDQSISDTTKEAIPLLVGHQSGEPAVGFVDNIEGINGKIKGNVHFYEVAKKEYDNAKEAVTSYLSIGFTTGKYKVYNEKEEEFTSFWEALDAIDKTTKKVVYFDNELVECSLVGVAASQGAGGTSAMGYSLANGLVKSNDTIYSEWKASHLQVEDNMNDTPNTDLIKEKDRMLSLVSDLPEELQQKAKADMVDYVYSGDFDGYTKHTFKLMSDWSQNIKKEADASILSVKEQASEDTKNAMKEENIKKLSLEDEGEDVTNYVKVKGAPKFSITDAIKNLLRGNLTEEQSNLSDYYGIQLQNGCIKLPSNKVQHLLYDERELSTFAIGTASASVSSTLPVRNLIGNQLFSNIFRDSGVLDFSVPEVIDNVSVPSISAGMYKDLETATPTDPALAAEKQKPLRCQAITEKSHALNSLGSTLTDEVVITALLEGISKTWATAFINGGGSPSTDDNKAVSLTSSSFVSRTTESTITKIVYKDLLSLVGNASEDGYRDQAVFYTSAVMFNLLATTVPYTGSTLAIATPSASPVIGGSFMGTILGRPCFVNSALTPSANSGVNSWVYLISPSTLKTVLYGGLQIQYTETPAKNAVVISAHEMRSLLVTRKTANYGILKKHS